MLFTYPELVIFEFDVSLNYFLVASYKDLKLLFDDRWVSGKAKPAQHVNDYLSEIHDRLKYVFSIAHVTRSKYHPNDYLILLLLYHPIDYLILLLLYHPNDYLILLLLYHPNDYLILLLLYHPNDYLILLLLSYPNDYLILLLLYHPNDYLILLLCIYSLYPSYIYILI